MIRVSAMQTGKRVIDFCFCLHTPLAHCHNAEHLALLHFFDTGTQQGLFGSKQGSVTAFLGQCQKQQVYQRREEETLAAHFVHCDRLWAANEYRPPPKNKTKRLPHECIFLILNVHILS